MPIGFGASVSAFTSIGLSSTASIAATTSLGGAGIYFSTAAANKEWDPSKWDFSSPETWNAAFQGFAIGSGAVGGIRSAGTFYKGLSSTWSKGAFIVGSTGTGGGLFVLNGFAANWDFSKPGVYFGFVDAITGAPDLPMFLRGAGRFLGKNGRNIVSTFDSFKSLNNQRVGGTVFSNLNQAFQGIDASEALKRLASKQTWSNTATFLGDLSSHQFSKSVGKIAGGVAIAGSSAYLMGSAVSENGWDLTSAYTYHAIINGMLTGGQLASSGRAYYRGKIVKNQLKLPKEMERIAQNYAKEALTIYQEILNKGGQVISGGHISSKVITIDGKDFNILDPGNKINKKNIKGIESIDRGNDVKDWVIKNGEEKFIVATTKNGWVTIDPKGEIQGISRLHSIRTGQDPISYGRQVKVQIKKGEVPNAAISVAVTKNLAVVTFSGTDSPGLVIFIDRKQGVTYTKPLARNKEIAGKKVTVDQSIENAINALRESGEDFPPWLPSNCAEPSALVALSSSQEAFPQSLNSRSYKTDDIDFLATYKVPKPFPDNIDFKKSLDPKFPDLVPFERCNHCKVTTGSVRNVITDPAWLKKIDDLTGLKEKLDYSKQRLYFLIPYHDVTNRIVKMNTTNNGNRSLSNRQKRSSDKRIMVEVEHSAIDHSINETGRWSEPNAVRNKKITSSATSSSARTGSKIKNLFSWIKSSIGGLLDSKSSTTTKNPISQVDAPIDINGTIMLLDVLIRKVTGQKYISTAGQSISQLEAQGYALNIKKGFEKVVEQAGLKSGISMHRLSIDYMGMQKEITRKVMSGKFNEISGILSSYVEKALPGREAGYPGKLSEKRFNEFMIKFNKGIDVTLNQSIEQILHNGDDRLEVDGAKKQQMNLEPQSYLSNASVQGHLARNKVKLIS